MSVSVRANAYNWNGHTGSVTSSAVSETEVPGILWKAPAGDSRRSRRTDNQPDVPIHVFEAERMMIKTTVCLTSSISVVYRQRHVTHSRFHFQCGHQSGDMSVVGSKFRRRRRHATFQVMTLHFEGSNFSCQDSLVPEGVWESMHHIHHNAR